jgi:uncharacterized protein with PQ loop repeat
MSNEIFTELLGWTAAIILLATISRQVYAQWRSRSAAGVSRWLFVGQVAASTAFLLYSMLLDNWVFVFTNAMMLVAALAGLVIDRRNRRLATPEPVAA